MELASRSPETLAACAARLVDEPDAFRLRTFLHEFGLAWQSAPNDGERRRLVAEPPPPLGARWDAFVAALAEHLCYHASVEPPSWVHGADRYLRQAWFPGGVELATLRVEAIVHAPAAFEAHGVLLARRELEVV